MVRTLILGYGNPDRGDDGVAYEVIDALRRRLGQEKLAPDETGLERLGNPVDSIRILQLAPELLEVAADYDRLIFVDAHVRPDAGDVHWTPLQPEYATATFTHHLLPATFLALLQVLHHREPEGFTLSIRGHSFDFHRGLSDATRAWVEPAVDQILSLLAQPAGAGR